MAIVLDGMGSDQYPEPEVLAAVEAARLFHEEIILVGQEDLLRPRLQAINTGGENVRIVHAPDVLEMGEKAVDSARRKPNNSMAVGLELVKTGQASAFVTAGNTGAAMFSSLRKLGRLPNVARPALTATFPTRTGRCIVLDIGANAECRPEFLMQFAIMGSVYAEKLLRISNPRIGLLANGEEPGKGNELVKAAYPLLQNSGVNFIGNVESKELFGGHVDVVVTDGFTGNVLLKTSEAAARLLTDKLKDELSASLITKLGAALAMNAFRNLKKTMDPTEYGAAPLLGIDGLAFVGHGRSNATALVNAIRVAREAALMDLQGALRIAIQERLENIHTASQE